jgi:hypothetical protein
MEVYFRELTRDRLPAVVAFVDPSPLPTDLSDEDIRNLLQRLSENVERQLCPGGIVYWFSAWQHTKVLTEAVEPVIGPPRDMIAWVRPDARPGTLYPQRYDNVATFVLGDTPVRAAQLARRRRRRSNVWNYPGGNPNGGHRYAARKPVALVVDAIEDCSQQEDIILDPFAGAGTTLIAAERSGRRARLLEPDPIRCDLIVRRWERFSGVPARLDAANSTFAEVAAERANIGLTETPEKETTA